MAYALSYREIEELLLERGISVDHSTVNRWVIKYSPSLEAEFTQRYKRRIGSSWRMGETYVKVKGKWYYLYRVIDKSCQTIDFYFSKYRDTKAAQAFFNKAIGYHGKPNKVTVDKSGANHAVLKISILSCQQIIILR